MDAHSFDRWTVALTQRPSRRRAVRLLVGGVLGGLLASRGSGLVRAQADTDGDQLLDEDEINVYGTLPNNADTDGDQANDGLEVWNRDQGLGDPDDPLVPDNPAAPPPPDMAPPPPTCIGLGGACSGIDQPCCGNDPAAFGYNNVICCPTANGSACTDIAGTFLCPDPGVPDTGCPVGQTNCGGFCTDLSLDHGNCGMCGQSCPYGSNCCAGTCVNVTDDGTNCGWCGRICEGGADAYCEVGVCKVFPPLPDPLF